MIERCVRFTTIPLNSYQIQHELDILNFVVENWLFLFVCFLEKQKLSCKLYLQHYWSDFQVSRYHPCESSLNGGSLKITPTAPLLLRLDQWLIDKKDMKWLTELSDCWMVSNSEAEFKEFKPRPWFTKTYSNWAPAQIPKHWTQFQVEPTMFEPRLKFEKQHKFFKFGHDLIMNKI